jgi:hypothetical protein
MLLQDLPTVAMRQREHVIDGAGAAGPASAGIFRWIAIRSDVAS